MTTSIRETARATALGRLAVYRQARAALHEDVRAAAIAGATQTEIARVSGLSRQHVATILKAFPAPPPCSRDTQPVP